MTSLFPPRESLVSDIAAGDGNIEKLFLRCSDLVVQVDFDSFQAFCQIWCLYIFFHFWIPRTGHVLLLLIPRSP
jgi:hypothetical protein